MEVARMKNSALLPIVLLSTYSLDNIEAQQCRPSGPIWGRKPPPNQYNQENDSDCCKDGKHYTTYKCSPQVSSHTEAFLTLNSFEAGGDGGGPSECDEQYHSDDTPVVALSTGYLIIPKHISLSTALRRMEMAERGGCFNKITISGNGRKVKAMVVDECDSMRGFDEAHDFQPPCDNNIVDASKAVWVALGVPRDDWGGLDITWSDA
ncbi:RIPENING-RELATED PROTEIN 2-RELATED [Salix viminalis]|uniref:RIPENING-RELATED PROTEIN 2-RELATED n=2 Tax=Salix viminalis TaxID=40686 RepID=A0A9Q0SF19_SALVM|nr:RIPENING-RELATED PROTEIN 2-RELATED [Salix viminalis]